MSTSVAEYDVKEATVLLTNPLFFFRMNWPQYNLAPHQVEIIESVDKNKETFCCAGNGLGKDFIAAFVALWWFLSRRPASVVTTSVKGDQLEDVLWGEMRRLINSSRHPLPIQYNHMKIRQLDDKEGNVTRFADLTELVGQVVNKNEGILGRHLPRDIPRTLLIFDEASGIDDGVYVSARTWAHHILGIGNPFPCENFFRRAVKEGDKKSIVGGGLLRKVIHVPAERSPNIQLAFQEILQGSRKPEPLLIRTKEQYWGIYTKEEYDVLIKNWGGQTYVKPLTTLIPGMIGFDEYLDRRANWDKEYQTISLDGKFYEGAEIKLFPQEWLTRAERIADSLKGKHRVALSMGLDTAMGGDETCWAISDTFGLIYLHAEKTPNTATIAKDTLALMQKYNIQPEMVCIDAGGGGWQIADQLRDKGYNVRTVAFGEAASLHASERLRRGISYRPTDRKIEEAETKYIYKNRRAEMYGLLSIMLDPSNEGWGIPAEYTELMRQLLAMPRQLDGEGQLYLPPKNRKPDGDSSKTKKTLTEILGRSPDHADAVVLSVFAMVHEAVPMTAGAA